MVRFWNRRHLVIVAIIVALSIGIVIASVPYLPPTQVPHGHLTTTQNVPVPGGSPTQPGVNQLELPGLGTTESFYVGVTVSDGTASFCVIKDQPYLNWLSQTPLTKATFPSGDCIGNTPTQETAQDTLMFLPTSSGTWYVVALNSNPSAITVHFSPA